MRLFQFIVEVGDICHGRRPGYAATLEKALHIPEYMHYIHFVDPVMIDSRKGNPRGLHKLLKQISNCRRHMEESPSAFPARQINVILPSESAFDIMVWSTQLHLLAFACILLGVLASGAVKLWCRWCRTRWRGFIGRVSSHGFLIRWELDPHSNA